MNERGRVAGVFVIAAMVLLMSSVAAQDAVPSPHAAVVWIVSQQGDDGTWDDGNLQSTALVMRAMSAVGVTIKSDEHGRSMKHAWLTLLEGQGSDGRFAADDATHVAVTLAVAESLDARNRRCKRAIQRATPVVEAILRSVLEHQPTTPEAWSRALNIVGDGLVVLDVVAGRWFHENDTEFVDALIAWVDDAVAAEVPASLPSIVCAQVGAAVHEESPERIAEVLASARNAEEGDVDALHHVGRAMSQRGFATWMRWQGRAASSVADAREGEDHDADRWPATAGESSVVVAAKHVLVLAPRSRGAVLPARSSKDTGHRRQLNPALVGERVRIDALPEVIEAVDWLAAQLRPSGAWGRNDDDIRTTSLALLALGAAGWSEKGNASSKVLRFLTQLERKRGAGRFADEDLDHVLATVALGELFDARYPANLLEPMRRAFVANERILREIAQSAPRSIDDWSSALELAGWALMAQRVIANRLDVELSSSDGVVAWIDDAFTRHRIAPSPRSFEVAYAGVLVHEPSIHHAMKIVAMGEDSDDVAQSMHAGMAIFQLDAHETSDPLHWFRWDAAVTRDALSTRVTTGPDAGSWPATDKYDAVTNTALHVLALSTATRYVHLVD